MAGIAQNMYHKEHSVESLNSIECLLKVKKNPNNKDPRSYKVLAKMTDLFQQYIP